MVIPGFIIDHSKVKSWHEPSEEEVLNHIFNTLKTHKR